MLRGNGCGTLGTIFILLCFAVCLGLAPAHAAEGQIVLGVCEPLSGPMKEGGDRYVAAVKFAAEKINAEGGVLGKKLVVVAEDSQLKADVATRKATKLILEDKADFIMAGTGSHVFKAMTKVAEQYKKVCLTYGTESASTTGVDFNPYVFRVCLSTDAHSAAVMEYFAKHTNYKKFYILCQDYAFGREAAEGFKKKLTAIPGSQLLGEELHPIGLKDFAPYITKVIASGAEVILTGNFGPDLENLIKTGAALGWKCVTGSYYLSDQFSMNVVKHAAIGSATADIYMITIDTPENKEFVRDWHAEHKNKTIVSQYPDLFSGRCYYGIRWLADVIKKAGSTEAEKIIPAWEGMDYNMPWGKVTMRKCDHQMITPGVAAVIQAKSEFYDFPFVGKPIIIPADAITAPPAETGNPRCK